MIKKATYEEYLKLRELSSKDLVLHYFPDAHTVESDLSEFGEDRILYDLVATDWLSGSDETEELAWQSAAGCLWWGDTDLFTYDVDN